MPPPVPEPGRHTEGHTDGLEPTSVSYYETALNAIETGDQQAALRNLRRVIYLQPNFVLAHYLTGVVQAQHDPAQASKPFKAAREQIGSASWSERGCL